MDVRSRGAPNRSERGAGLVGTAIGVFVLLVLILFATQVSYALYARSAVTAAAYDAARVAAGAQAQSLPDHNRVSAGDAHVRHLLGRFGKDRVSTEWTETRDQVALTVTARLPSLVPAPLRRAMRLDVVRRTVHVRIEEVR